MYEIENIRIRCTVKPENDLFLVSMNDSPVAWFILEEKAKEYADYLEKTTGIAIWRWK